MQLPTRIKAVSPRFQEIGKFWQARHRAVRLLDETAILACEAYVDLNPIRAAMAETIKTSDYTSAQQRALELRESLQKGMTDKNASTPSQCVEKLTANPIAKSLCPLTIDELRDEIGACCHTAGDRASESTRSHNRHQRYKIRNRARELLTA